MQTQAAQELASEMRMRGVRLEGPACDVTNDQSVKHTFSKYQGEMPPIKGCIQASMVLKVGLAKCECDLKTYIDAGWPIREREPRGL